MTGAFHSWRIEAIDPLIFGDGRPFTGQPGARLTGLPLPSPHTLAGVVRTRAGQDERGVFTMDVEEARAITVHGPFLVGEDGDGTQVFFPAPADAFIPEPARQATGVRPRRLVPLRAPVGAHGSGALAPVHLPVPDPARPWRRAPALWRWSWLRPWLSAGAASGGTVEIPVHHGLDIPVEVRTHVTIDRRTGIAREGNLFMTAGRRYDLGPGRVRFSIGLRTSATSISPGAGQLGGERRFGRWVPGGFLDDIQAPPEEVLASAEDGWVRLVMATPAFSSKGSDLQPALANAGRVVGQVNGRPQVVSGWDLARRRPKPLRRLIPAGSVFFLSLAGSAAERRRWVADHWLQPLSDDAGARRDGFGLALFGAWDGAIHPMHT